MAHRLKVTTTADSAADTGCDEVFIDKASGTPARRPELDNAPLSVNRGAHVMVVIKLGHARA